MLDFIYSAPNALSEKQCNRVIKFFELHPEEHEYGTTLTDDENRNGKKSIDWCKAFSTEDAVDILIQETVTEHTHQYMKNYRGINCSNNRAFQIDDFYNLQKYEPGQGFNSWHHEYDSISASSRVLAWMIYLNTVPDGGTMFLDQDMTVDAEAGKLLIWPAYWTHTHKSQVSYTTRKYIATGWHVYEESNDGVVR